MNHTHVITVITTPATRIEAETTDTYTVAYTADALEGLANTLRGYIAVPGAVIVMWPFTDRKVN